MTTQMQITFDPIGPDGQYAHVVKGTAVTHDGRILVKSVVCGVEMVARRGLVGAEAAARAALARLFDDQMSQAPHATISSD